MARLGGDDVKPAAPGRRVPVDWDFLEIALTSNSGEWASYLDVETGLVELVSAGLFGAAGDGLTEEEIEARLGAGRLIHVQPLDSSVEFGWMEEFAASVTDHGLRRRLRTGLGRNRPFRRFKDALDDPGERRRWFAFRDARVRAAAREWLAEHGIEPTTAPPERSP